MTAKVTAIQKKPKIAAAFQGNYVTIFIAAVILSK